jgi:hypothetical protein
MRQVDEQLTCLSPAEQSLGSMGEFFQGIDERAVAAELIGTFLFQVHAGDAKRLFCTAHSNLTRGTWCTVLWGISSVEFS